MSFDLKKFDTTRFNYREKEIDVPELKMFFPGKEKAKWKVRGLSGIELAMVRDAAVRNQNFENLLEMITSNFSKDKIEAVKETFGMSDKAPEDYVRRIAILRLGSIDPEIQQEHAVKLAESFPVTFTRLTDQIMILTGEGKMGESIASGTMKK